MKLLIFFLLLAGALLFSGPVLADVNLNSPIKVGNALSVTGNPQPTVLEIVVGAFLGFGAILAVFAFGWLIIGGFRLIIARDNPDRLTAANHAIWGAVIGFISALLSVTIILAVSTLLGGTGVNELANPNKLQIPIREPLFLGAFTTIFTGILALAFIVCVLMAVYGGFRLIFSGGNEEQVTAGKTILKWAVVGLAVVMFSYIIIYGINRLFTQLPAISKDPTNQRP
ncbi:MAG: hypothetical protein HY397_00180 [Candidatus Doudnabacteria bacterium]|nr:hypothetical protein [Candidatus Doudnabacteria bacterium]